jgi:hypothetical protein
MTDVREDTNGMDPLLENHVQISQLINDTNNGWVSTSGESQLLDEVFHDSNNCVEALWKGGVFKEKCLPDNKYEMPATLTTRLRKLDMFDDIYANVGNEEEGCML